jgi:hypothetical protein
MSKANLFKTVGINQWFIVLTFEGNVCIIYNILEYRKQNTVVRMVQRIDNSGLVTRDSSGFARFRRRYAMP